MKAALRILPAAVADVDAAALFIARDSVDAAIRFHDAVDITCEQIQEFPTRSPRYELPEPQFSELRRRAVQGFRNYLIFYRFDGDAVDVIRVLHGARDIPAILAYE
ncbi:MAG TPA: type II toxin-antitoxin system RelE/ParE family toxin [Tepidisphaeraceae bacterium]|nr:type II toxin-antitoxin system RelE/ParE family toxin [Tepidisphaeraceae bacterium]